MPVYQVCVSAQNRLWITFLVLHTIWWHWLRLMRSWKNIWSLLSSKQRGGSTIVRETTQTLNDWDSHTELCDVDLHRARDEQVCDRISTHSFAYMPLSQWIKGQSNGSNSWTTLRVCEVIKDMLTHLWIITRLITNQYLSISLDSTLKVFRNCNTCIVLLITGKAHGLSELSSHFQWVGNSKVAIIA